MILIFVKHNHINEGPEWAPGSRALCRWTPVLEEVILLFYHLSHAKLYAIIWLISINSSSTLHFQYNIKMPIYEPQTVLNQTNETLLLSLLPV